MFTKIIKNICKVIISGLIASIILSLLLFVYYISPIHIENVNGNTDYVWLPNAMWVKLTEGISIGKFDEKGFNNKNVIENPDIIILGSSHMEATNVMQNENTGYLLNQKLNEKYTVYNMGISGHHFFKICQYLPVSLELYSPQIAIIETSTVDISEMDVKKVLEKSVEYTPSHNTGLIGFLQKIPFFRLVYQQINTGLIDLFIPSKETTSSPSENISRTDDTNSSDNLKQSSYDELFSFLAEQKEKYNVEMIIFYHPMETITEENTIKFENTEASSMFSTTAQKYGIIFVNMEDDFKNMFYKEHHLPHGFITGEIGTGHLNKYGHAAIAESLYNTILKIEENAKICK